MYKLVALSASQFSEQMIKLAQESKQRQRELEQQVQELKQRQQQATT